MVYVMSFLALFLFADKLVAQHNISGQPTQKLYQLDYENSSGEIAVTTFYYNENDVMEKSYWTCTDGSRSSDNYYRYNEKYQMISAYRVFSDMLTSYEFFLYDDEGRKIHETFVRSDNIIGSADYVYDKKGHCDHVICDHYKGWLTGKIVFKNNKKGQAQKADIIRDDTIIAKIVFEYDKDDNLIKDVWTFNSGFTQTFVYHYESATVRE